MTSTQLTEIEDSLKKLAELLATLNLEQNEVPPPEKQILVETQKTSEQIEQLRSRIDKKVLPNSTQRKLVDQETSDKLLMEERLLATERKSEQLKVKVASLTIQAANEKHSKPHLREKEETPIVTAHPHANPKPIQQKHEQTPKVGPTLEQDQQQDSDYYSNSNKGDYQPPLLFADAPAKVEQTSKPDEDEDDILARIRRNVDSQ